MSPISPKMISHRLLFNPMRISQLHVTKTAESTRAFEPPAYVPETATTNVLVSSFSFNVISGVYVIYFVDEINKTNRVGFSTCWSRSTDRQYALRTRTLRPCHVCLSFSYLGSTFPLVSYAHGMGGAEELCSLLVTSSS